MIEKPFSEKRFESYMRYYVANQKIGKLKYFWEISVPDNEFDELLSFLNCVDNIGFSFGFQVLNRYENYKLLYGFTNFDIIRKTKNMKLFSFNAQSNEALFECVYDWHKESSCYLISDSVLFNIIK